MGKCISKEPARDDPHPNDVLLSDPRAHHQTPLNIYRGASLQRHGSMGVASPSMFHVNSSTGNYYGKPQMNMNYRKDLYNTISVFNFSRLNFFIFTFLESNAGQKIQALHDYEKSVDGDLSFRKGDIMWLVEER